jgi:Cu-Zn family superoxide dismutase
VIGHSIVVHGGADDFKTQPSGNSGTRIGCGVITK